MKNKLTKKLLSALLALAMLLSLLPSFSLTAAAAPAAVSFVKVTDADQIAVDNIGECTFDEAKAWVYDNWDSVTNGVDSTTYIDILYIVNGSARVIDFITDDLRNKDEFKALTAMDSNAGLTAIKNYYNSGDDVVYVCSKAAAPEPVSY